MTILTDEADVRLQLRIWRYAITGNVCEPSAAIAEDKNVQAIVPGAWDRSQAWLETQWMAHGNERYHHPPEHWCLPAVTDLRLIRKGYAPAFKTHSSSLKGPS